MLSCSNSYKEKMKVYGKKINVLLEFDNQALDKNKVVSLEQTVNGEMFTSVCRLLTLEVEKNKYATQSELLLVKDVNTRTVKSLMQTKVKYLVGVYENADITKASEVNVKIGVKLEDDEDYEYVDWGKFVVYELKDCVDTKSYKLTLYDHLIDTHIKYSDSPLTLNFASNNVTVKVLLQAICNKFGFTLKTTTFTNANKIVDGDKFSNLDVTYRDILDEIACTAGGFIKIFNKDLYVAYPQETNQTIDEEDLKSLDVGNKVGAFNTLVLSRSPQEDNIYYPTTIPEDERVAIRIENNQIMDSHREDFIVDLYNRVNGLEYYVFECEHYGFAYYEFGDIVTLKDLHGQEYKTMMFNIIDTINTGITGKIYSDETEFAETKYEYATSIEKRIKNTEIICNKQEGQIKLLIEESSKTSENVTKIQLDVGKIGLEVKQKVGNSEFGTLIEQNYSHVKIAWNSISKYIQFESGELRIYDGKDASQELRSVFNESGEHFYRDGYYVGNIGTNEWSGNKSYKGLVFDLDYQGQYMAFAQRSSSSEKNYKTMLCFSRANSIYDEYGIHLGCNLYGENFTLNDFAIGSISAGGYIAYTGEIPIITSITDNGDGSINWTYSKLRVYNGIIVGYWN